MTTHRALLSAAVVCAAITSSVLAGNLPCESSPLDPKKQPRDCRDRFEMTVFAGRSIDTFAADSVDEYLNPKESGEIKERYVAGFDFAYRLSGDKNASDDQFWKSSQLWIYGETIHGVRSSDVDCGSTDKDKAAPVCKPFADPNGVLDKTKYILRNASSLEGFAGLRWEIKRLSFTDAEGFAASVYLKAQAGFLTVDGQPDDLIDMHHAGVGLILTGSRFVGSYVELGHGRTDLFLDNRTDRWKVDGFGSYQLGEHIAIFAQICLDADLSTGSDTIQTYYGLDVDPSILFLKK